VPRPKASSDAQDFIKLNRMAAKEKIGSAAEAREFRARTDAKLTEKGSVGPPPKVIPSDVIPSFAYGRKSRPSTPIASVVGGQYATEYESHLDNLYQSYSATRNDPSKKCKVRVTKACSIRISNARAAKAAPEEIKVPWTMTKFRNVQSRNPAGARLVPLGSSASAPTLTKLDSLGEAPSFGSEAIASM